MGIHEVELADESFDPDLLVGERRPRRVVALCRTGTRHRNADEDRESVACHRFPPPLGAIIGFRRDRGPLTLPEMALLAL